jgi:uncharacterized protein (DUF302 family)
MRSIGILATFALAFLLGGVATSFAAKEALPRAMFKEVRSPFDHGRTVEIIQERVAAQPGWRITADIDQRAAILAGGGEDVGPYRILKVCHGGHAARMLAADERRYFGVMMPISVAVYQRADGHAYVALVNGDVLSKVIGGEHEAILADVRYQVEEIFQFLHLSFDILG